ncbi:rhodanese-like domain-containing protein [Ornithinibacillus halophilus]|nr:rhodanese-like domain-containing protein [Ornithinibacillus halophilus]
MKKKVLLILIILVAILSACTSNENATIVDVSVDEAKDLLDDEEVVVLDVRTIEEYSQGHIPNAQLLPLQELEARLSELNEDQKYLVVCRSGNRSAQASTILIQNGFQNIYNMTGGMNNWPYEVK